MIIRNLLIATLLAFAVACASQDQADDESNVSVAAQALESVDGISGKPDVPNVDQTLAAEAQARITKRSPSEQVSTRLTVRFHRNGELEVIDAVQLPGYLKLEKHLGRSYVYEASLNGVVMAVQGIDADFDQRAISAERDINFPVDSMEVFIDIPGIGVDEAEEIEITLHEIAATHDEKFASIASVDRLKKTNKVKQAARIGGADVGRFIRTNARRVRTL